MAKVVVTGGAGFIGSHLAGRMLTEGHQVVVIDNYDTGRRENLSEYEDKITLCEINICNLEAMQSAMKGADYVLHQAALPSVPRSLTDPLESHSVNTTGTLNALIAARDNGVKRFVYAASSSAYGDTEVSPKHEELVPNPISPYGAAKLTGEHYCKVFYDSFGLETVSLRYFNVFGPRQNPHSAYTGVMAIFIPLMLQDKEPTIYGDGTQTRDFTYIDNNIHANWLSLFSEKAPGQMMNIACGDSQTVLQIVNTINDILGKNIEPKFEPTRPGDIQHSCAAIDKAKTLLNFEPIVKFEEGVKRTIAWYRQELGLA